MKGLRFALASLAFWGLLGLPGLTCDLAEPGSLEYALQEDNRCEGIQERIDVSGSLDLISLTSTRGGSLGSSLRIRVPKQDSSQPFFYMQELDSRYRLDNILFTAQGDFYLYNLSTRILRDSGIDSVSDLRAIANIGTQRIYLPTLLGDAVDRYRFVFYSVDTVRFVEAKIRSSSKDYASWGSQGARSGEKAFEWSDADNAPAGRYEFYYVAEIEQGNRSPERISRTIAFWHDPAWLR
jgi:flagellar basal-body rod modification protein FlgD